MLLVFYGLNRLEYKARPHENESALFELISAIGVTSDKNQEVLL